MVSQRVYLYIDGSGGLGKSDPKKYFVYAGVGFKNEDAISLAKQLFIHREKIIRDKYKLDEDLEIKGSLMFGIYKTDESQDDETIKTINSIRFADKFATIASNSKINVDISTKMNKQRIKDYILKRRIKDYLQHLVDNLEIDPNIYVELFINIDQQSVKSSAIRELKESIQSELSFGVWTAYGNFKNPLFNGGLKVQVNYLDSKYEPLLRLSDFLAHDVWSVIYENDSRRRKKIKNVDIKEYF